MNVCQFHLCTSLPIHKLVNIRNMMVVLSVGVDVPVPVSCGGHDVSHLAVLGIARDQHVSSDQPHRVRCDEESIQAGLCVLAAPGCTHSHLHMCTKAY